MKQAWLKISARIDNMSLRERAMVFAVAAALIMFVMFYFFLNPSAVRHKAMLDGMALQQGRIASVEEEIAKIIEAHNSDPDAAERARLSKIEAEAQTLKKTLMTMQQGMVPAERMSGMLEEMLRAHRGLKLTAMRTLDDVAPDAAAVPVPAAAPIKPPAPQMLHRHGVELVLQGSYLDMVAYMSALENMQGQVFWDGASMVVDSYPSASLTLTIYTVNLDKKWLKL